MQWIKEVEMVDSVVDLKSSSSTRGIQTTFLITRCEDSSALNKIIHNTHVKRRISLEEQEAQKQDRFLRGRQIAYQTMPTYSLLVGLKVGRNFIAYDENPT